MSRTVCRWQQNRGLRDREARHLAPSKGSSDLGACRPPGRGGLDGSELLAEALGLQAGAPAALARRTPSLAASVLAPGPKVAQSRDESLGQQPLEFAAGRRDGAIASVALCEVEGEVLGVRAFPRTREGRLEMLAKAKRSQLLQAFRRLE